MKKITLSDDQEIAFKAMAKWLATGKTVLPTQKSPNLLTFAGYAGTGKTTVVSLLANQFSSAIRFAFCALSGKASSVLRQKLIEQGMSFNKGDPNYCGTIHSLIYIPIENDDGEVVHWSRRPEFPFDVIVLDEASMVSEDIYKDLASYGKPILAIGDHGQLPPIEGKFSLMDKPDIKLEKIHRQAESNPIINMSMIVRTTGKIPDIKDSANIKIIKKSEYGDFLKSIFTSKLSKEKLLDIAVLCYKNATRNSLNTLIRGYLFGKILDRPQTDDLVICLRNSLNHKQQPLYNGYRGYLAKAVEDIGDHHYGSRIRFPFEDFEIDAKKICKYQFGYSKTFNTFSELEPFGMEVKHWSQVGLLFDYGYALTVHKMQGSQAENIILYNERPFPVSEDNYRRWAYTAVTRSSENLIILK